MYCHNDVLNTLSFVLAAAVMAMTADAASDIRGRLDWPERWTVFAPVERDAPVPAREVLASIPDRLDRGDGTMLEPRRIEVPAGERIDLADSFDAQRIGNTAWLFTTLRSEEARTVTLGMGADHWFTAWINGEQVLSTPETGNHSWPPRIEDFTAEVSLRAGDNVLAVRFITGRASALFAAGGPDELRQARRRIGSAQDPMRFNRPVPYPERMPFDADRQAFASAELPFELPPPEVDLSTGALTGLQALPVRQLHLVDLHGRPEVHDTEYRRFPYEPVKLRLSKMRYPAEDRHLDVLVWTTPPEGLPDARARDGVLEVRLRSAAGDMLAAHTIDILSETGWFFALGIPDALVGREGVVEIVWRQDETEIGRDAVTFHVLPPADVARAGRIPIRIANPSGAVLPNAPMTTGVPFPHGALASPEQVRLVDAEGRSIPLQTRVAGRWSRFGPIKWLLCDFTVDLDGDPRELFLEFGNRASGVGRRASMGVNSAHSGFPDIDAGRLRFGPDGLWFDAAGNGDFQQVLDADALNGAFVRHENGTVYRPDPATPFVIEETGPEKTVVRRAGWYVAEPQLAVAGPIARSESVLPVPDRPPEARTGAAARSADGRPVRESGATADDTFSPTPNPRFCNYVTRFVLHRDSPVVRIDHTWIFTGDGNRDRIAEMGWRFDTAEALSPDGMLATFEDPDAWHDTHNLIQFDHSQYIGAVGADPMPGRTPGVMRGAVGAVRVHFGATDFWQNFPSELAFEDRAMVFYNWPRHNPPVFTPHPIPAGEAFRLRYAHEGELLDFTTPDDYLDGPIWNAATLDGRDPVWPKGDRRAINAQGVARTEQMRLYLTDAAVSPEAAARVMQGLDTATLRAVVDPVWVAASGAFERIHHQDFDRFPQEETLYAEICRAPARWNERLGAYGMWVHGDFPVDNISLNRQTASPRRTWKKGHHGWPYKFMPYARSGDPALFKLAEAGSRQMIDGNFRHYVSPEVVSDPLRDGQGWTGTSMFPWLRVSNRSISQDVDYLWHHWALTGIRRPVDVALLWMEIAKLDTSRCLPGRISVSQMHYYLDTYKATFDPWFLIAVQEIAALHEQVWDGETPDTLTTDTVGHFWKPAQYDYTRFTGDEAQARIATRLAVTWSSPWAYTKAWNRLDVPFIEESAQAWFLTGDPHHLGRIRGQIDSAAIQVFDGLEPAYLRGSNMRHGGASTALELFTGWYIQHFPLGLHALAASGLDPEPIPEPFFQRPRSYPVETVGDAEFHRIDPPEILLRHDGAAPLPVFFDAWHYRDALTYDYRLTGPDGRVALEGQWQANAIDRIDLPAGAPAGLYRLRMTALDPEGGRGHAGGQFWGGSIRIPSTPPEVPEIVVFETTDSGTHVGSSLYETQYWFRVPEGLREFWIAFSGDGAKIWNPDGEVAWCAWRDARDAEGRAAIPVPHGQADRLWRLTRPGVQTGFTVDPRIPPWFSISRAKWFDPTVDE